MKRRDFMLRSGAAGAALALPLGAAAGARRLPLLDDPRAWLGEEFTTGEGRRLRLTEVRGVRVDRDTLQADLRFAALDGGEPCLGVHELHGDGEAHALYLQPCSDGSVACINRLRRTRA